MNTARPESVPYQLFMVALCIYTLLAVNRLVGRLQLLTVVVFARVWLHGASRSISWSC